MVVKNPKPATVSVLTNISFIIPINTRRYYLWTSKQRRVLTGIHPMHDFFRIQYNKIIIYFTINNAQKSVQNDTTRRNISVIRITDFDMLVLKFPGHQ